MDHGRLNGSAPHFVCASCGDMYGRKECSDFATWHVGECGVCGDEQVPVTKSHDFGGLYDTWKEGREFQ